MWFRPGPCHLTAEEDLDRPGICSYCSSTWENQSTQKEAGFRVNFEQQMQMGAKTQSKGQGLGLRASSA
jgi:hypothetical protein